MTLQDQQDARTTMTKPPHAETPDSLRATPAGASTARPSHAPAPPTIRQNGRYAVLPTEFPDNQLQARQDAGQADAGACVCFCDHVCPTRYHRDAKANAAQPTPCLVSGVCRQLHLLVSPSRTCAQAHD